MKFDDEQEAKGVTSAISLAIAIVLILLWTSLASLGILDRLVEWLK